MTARAAPDLPEYRITLFYGPERDPTAAPEQHCVYNVKKRSWKGGIQVDVRITDATLGQIAADLDFSAWLQQRLHGMPDDEAAAYRDRAREALVRETCRIKLELAIAAGLPSANTCVAAGRHAAELPAEVGRRTEAVRRAILAELDLPPHGGGEGSAETS